MRSYCTAQGTISTLLGQHMMGDNVGKGMCVCVCVCVYIYIYIYIYMYVCMYVCMCVCVCVCIVFFNPDISPMRQAWILVPFYSSGN